MYIHRHISDEAADVTKLKPLHYRDMILEALLYNV